MSDLFNAVVSVLAVQPGEVPANTEVPLKILQGFLHTLYVEVLLSVPAQVLLTPS